MVKLFPFLFSCIRTQVKYLNVSPTSILEESLTGLQLNTRTVLWLHQVFINDLTSTVSIFFNQETKSEQYHRKS